MTTDTEDTDPGPPARTRTAEPDKKIPGKLHGRVETRFHTGEAVALVNGRAGGNGKAHITGLKGFAKRTQAIMNGSGFGDPFADYCLVQIEVQLDDIDEWMRDKGQELKAMVEKRLDPGITADGGVAYETRTWSTAPIEEEFILGHYGSMALHRLKQFDEVVLLVKGLQHHHVITIDECRKVIEEAGNRIRGLLAIGNTYDYWGCTRDDLKNRTRRGMAAVEKLKASRFINKQMFNDDDDICNVFATYSVKPKYLADTTGDETAGDAPSPE